MNTKVFHNLSYGVYIISSLDGGTPYRLHSQQCDADHFLSGVLRLA